MTVYEILSGCYKVIKEDEKLMLLIIRGDASMRLSYMFICDIFWFYSTSAGKLNKRIIPISNDN